MVPIESRVLHLFAGSGGGMLGSVLLGEEIVGAVEWEKYPRETVLARQRDGVLPTFPIWDDVSTFRLDNPETREYIEYLISIRDTLTVAGGFPCQDISIAGKGAGIEGSRSGLWGEMCRIIAEIRPRHILLENSPMLIVRGFDRVISDLAEIRYSLAWGVMGAADAGANHQRDRFWGFGTAEEYLDGAGDPYTDTYCDGCVEGGGKRACETDSNFRGIGLKHLVEDVPYKMWPAEITPPRREVRYPTPIAHDRLGAIHAVTRRDGKSRMDQLATFVKWTEEGSPLRRCRTTKEEPETQQEDSAVAGLTGLEI